MAKPLCCSSIPIPQPSSPVYSTSRIFKSPTPPADYAHCLARSTSSTRSSRRLTIRVTAISPRSTSGNTAAGKSRLRSPTPPSLQNSTTVPPRSLKFLLAKETFSCLPPVGPLPTASSQCQASFRRLWKPCSIGVALALPLVSNSAPAIRFHHRISSPPKLNGPNPTEQKKSSPLPVPSTTPTSPASTLPLS